MAKISKSGIGNGNTIQAEHITRIIDALDGTGSADIVATGSFTGSFIGSGAGLTGVISSSYSVSASYATLANQSISALSAVTAGSSISASYSATANTASYALNIANGLIITASSVSASFVGDGSQLINLAARSISGSITASNLGTGFVGSGTKVLADNNTWITLPGSTTSNSVYVSTTGNDSTGTRNDFTKHFLTLEAARNAASSGDIIFVYPGTYTVTTTASFGVAKDGVSYYFQPGTIINKSSSGDLFNETGFTNSCNVYGYGVFNKTTSTGRILYNTTANATFEALSCTSTIDTIFTTARGKMKFKVDYATSTAGYVLRMENSNTYTDSVIDVNMIYWKSTSTAVIGSPNWWYYTILRVTGEVIESTANSAIAQYNNGVELHLNIGQILGTTYGVASGDGYAGNPSIINCNYCSGISDVGKPYIVNGEFNVLVYGGVYTFSSYVNGGRFNSITLNGTGRVKATLAGLGAGSVATLTQSSGIADLDIDSAHYGIGFNITGGTCNILSYRTQGQLSSATDRIVNGGTLNIYSTFTHGGSVDAGLWYGIKLQSGTLRLFSNLYNLFDQPGNSYTTEAAHGIIWLGGKLIVENSSIVTTNTLSYPIKAAAAGLQLRVNGRLSHNRVEHGTVLDGKKHKCKYVVNAVASTGIYCNDGSGGDELFQETNTGVYNTKALLAARMVSLINASGTLDMTASQDNAGTDEYFYLELDTAGYNFLIRGNANVVTNLTPSIIRIGSYAITEIIGGNIVENINVE